MYLASLSAFPHTSRRRRSQDKPSPVPDPKRRREVGRKLKQSAVPSLSSVVTALEPFEAPWTREVLFDCGKWTAYLNNGLYGGDPTAGAPYLTGPRCVVQLSWERW